MARGFSALGIISVSSSSVIILFQFFFIISLTRSFYCSPSSSENSSKFRWIRYTSLGTFICLALAFIIWIIEDCLYRLHEDENIWITWYWLFFLCLAMSFELLYILMLLRLYFTFQESEFEIDTKTLRSHIFIIILFTLIMPIAVIARIFDFEWIFLGLVLLLLFVYFLSSFHLIYLFNKKLFELSLSIRQISIQQISNDNSFRNNPNIPHKTTSLNERQLELLKIIRKHTLLGCIILIVIMCDIGIVAIYTIIPNYILWCIGWMVTINVVTLCVYLGFTGNKNQYQFMCKRCDVCCKKLCNNIAGKRMIKASIISINIPRPSKLKISHHPTVSDEVSTVSSPISPHSTVISTTAMATTNTTNI